MFVDPRLKQWKRCSTHSYCHWCVRVQKRRSMYKVRDGPIDWWFCNDDHALEWLHWRHRNPVMYHTLKTGPKERRRLLGDRSIDEYARDSVSSSKQS